MCCAQFTTLECERAKPAVWARRIVGFCTQDFHCIQAESTFFRFHAGDNKHRLLPVLFTLFFRLCEFGKSPPSRCQLDTFKKVAVKPSSIDWACFVHDGPGVLSPPIRWVLRALSTHQYAFFISFDRTHCVLTSTRSTRLVSTVLSLSETHSDGSSVHRCAEFLYREA